MCSVQRYSNIYQHVVSGKAVLFGNAKLQLCACLCSLSWWGPWQSFAYINVELGIGFVAPIDESTNVQQWIKVFAVAIYMCLWRSHS